MEPSGAELDSRLSQTDQSAERVSHEQKLELLPAATSYKVIITLKILINELYTFY